MWPGPIVGDGVGKVSSSRGWRCGGMHWPRPTLRLTRRMRCLPCSSLKETERGMSVVLRLTPFWREHGRGSRITCLSSSGSRECLSCSISETDLAPFRLPEKELLRESDLAWEGRGAGESLPTAGRDRERAVVVLTCMGPLVRRHRQRRSVRAKISASSPVRQLRGDQIPRG